MKQRMTSDAERRHHFENHPDVEGGQSEEGRREPTKEEHVIYWGSALYSDKTVDKRRKLA